MFGVGTHQPFKIASHGCELILVRPEHERYANHVKARQQQIALVGRTVAEQQSLDKEEVLEVAEVDQDPRVERFHVDGRIEYVFGIKRQAGGNSDIVCSWRALMFLFVSSGKASWGIAVRTSADQPPHPS